ncbi:tetratricopeptide repeat protein [Desertivirga brevis]|uniref:tetratricopeptide repeat protein n=1 Tax=Desertivirga brevis TaxID=2810310 RepID=UPI001A96F9C7|nr:tetratricopeptide repeat protein [Pedobacter sp. SYSU D00873]
MSLSRLNKSIFYLIAFCLLPASLVFGQGRYDKKLQQTQMLINQSPDVAYLKIKSLLQEALNKDDTYTVGACYRQIGEIFYHQAAFSQALDNYYKADALFRKKKYDRETAENLNKIGNTYYYTHQYDVALKIFKEALDIYNRIRDKIGIAESMGLIGQAYEKSGDHNRAFDFQNKALEQYKKAQAQAGIAKIHENIGSLYEDKMRLDSALKHFKLALLYNSNQGDKMAQIEVLNNLGDVYRKSADYRQALLYTHKAADLATRMKEHYQLASAYRDLSKTYNLMGRNDSAYYYSDAGREIYQTIFSEDNKNQQMVLQTLFEIEQKDNAIAQFQNDKQLNLLIIFSTILISILLVCLGISVISRQRLKIKNEQQLNEQNRVLYESQKKSLEFDLRSKHLKEESLKGELELKSKELTSHTLHLIKKNQLLDELKDKLNAMIKDDKRDQRKELKQVINLINQNNNQDKNWEDFRIVFERVHENFFDRLKKHSNALTSSDYRLVALLKMNLNSADIATMLGISQDSLRIARYRLRKKLNLEEGENLSAFLQNL